jgi:hypothetical protein
MCRKGLVAIAALVLGLSSLAVFAATKTVDLDGQTANGAESKCDLNVLSTFPVQIENVVTNKAVGDSFEFTWASAGPGGFRSSVTPGTAGGVGARWVWTTNQTVYAYTGSSCDRDICFLKTAGPDTMGGTCSTGCADDGVAMTMSRGTGGAVNLLWSGGTASYTVYRSNLASGLTAPANAVSTTSNLTASDTPPAGAVFFYQVRGSSCITPKACTTNAQCNPASEGVCVSKGPFSVPGRSLSATDVTVSSASLTSSLITFFSPPKKIFEVTSTAQPGGMIDAITNNSTQPVTYTSEAYPPGCCPSGTGDHPVRCDGTCVDVLNDPNNCGACGNVCGDGTCCSGGECVSLCSEGRIWCDGQCVDPVNDSDNCGACGNTCSDGTCCTKAYCGSMCELGRTFCDGICLDTVNDPNNCGACGNVCGEGSVCDDGACVACGEGQTSCNNVCVSLNSDPYNCGACGHDCNASCPTGQKGVCGAEQVCSCAPGTPLPRPIPPIVQAPTDAFCPTFDDHPEPVAGVCPQSAPSGPLDGEAPVCTVDPTTTTVAVGETATICRPGGILFKEVPTQVSVCGDGIPGQDGECSGGISKVTTGTFMRLVPITDADVGNAYLTPYKVHVTNETGINDLVSGSPVGDGLFEPGETANISVDLVNAGPLPIQGAIGTITAPAVDLTDDGVNNPVGVTIVTGTANYGTIAGTLPTTDCSPVTVQPKAGSTPFKVTIPSTHPGDTTHPLVLNVTGTVGGSPFTMSVPLSLGIADRCVFNSGSRDFDGLDGFQTPMGGMAPAEDPVPFPGRTFNPGSTLPFKMRQLCGGVELKGTDVDPPQIVGLSEATRGAIDLSLIVNADTGTSDPLFRWNDTTKRWIFNMDTDQIGTGTFTLTIKIAGRKNYVTGFVLQ